MPNRAAFYTHAGKALATADRDRYTAILLLDLDGFKPVNDTLGHAAGDTLLVGVGARLTQAVRSGDIIARLGGDEFAAVLTGLDGPDRAHEISERLLDRLGAPLPVAGTVLQVRGSVGLSVVFGPGHDLETLLHQADTALYAAKAAGKGVVRRHAVGMEAAVPPAITAVATTGN
ncbi:diguanylate cyclase domain-containing protein [Actinoplanes sp. NPDC051859]|uniref:diguanylate cyclase domain-containing protein n=1 Tax=Actinoplanes sp. NPDC051859 TaxID=3363909 RepID=UPI0037B7F328